MIRRSFLQGVLGLIPGWALFKDDAKRASCRKEDVIALISPFYNGRGFESYIPISAENIIVLGGDHQKRYVFSVIPLNRPVGVDKSKSRDGPWRLIQIAKEPNIYRVLHPYRYMKVRQLK